MKSCPPISHPQAVHSICAGGTTRSDLSEKTIHRSAHTLCTVESDTVHRGSAILAPQEIGTLFARMPSQHAEIPPTFGELTTKQLEVFGAVARGRSNAEIATELFLGESTVKTHVGAILRKLELRDRVQIVVFAYEHGIVEPGGGGGRCR